MEVEIQLTNAPIPGQTPPPKVVNLGAWVEFRGVVRGEEDGLPIAALEYEAYPPMAEREIRRLLTELSAAKPCLVARVIHRIGLVPVGEAALYVGMAGRHRAEAFSLLAEFMNRLKADVPIWKRRGIVRNGIGSSGAAQSLGSVASPASKPARNGQEPGHPASAGEVLSLLHGLCQPLGTERVALAGAAGRVLREAVCAPEDQPAFDRSSVDGYAVRVDDPAAEFRIVDEIRAGEWKPRVLQIGEAVRIATGGALPGEGLQVVMKEDVCVESGRLAVLRRSKDHNVRFRGEDARAGQVLVQVGTLLQPGSQGLLASVGYVHPLVTRLPRILHVATGNEILPPGQTPQRGQIRDSNSTLVRAFLSQWGITPEQRRVGENESDARSEIRGPKSELPDLDLLLISGGASVGEHDFTRRLLEDLGFTIHVSKTIARPGKPLIVGQRGDTWAFGLPGNPLAHFVCLNLYVRAVLEKLAGRSGEPVFQIGELGTDLIAEANARETFWPARWQLQDGIAALTPLRWSSSGDVTALATANALIRVATGAQHLTRGNQVEFACTERRA